MSTTKDIMMRAAELIEQRGHCKGKNMDANGRVCMLGALGLAVFGPDAFTDRAAADPEKRAMYDVATTALRNHIRSRDLHWAGFATGYNDAEERTAEEVVATLRAVEC
jgi:hypothetical protein